MKCGGDRGLELWPSPFKRHGPAGTHLAVERDTPRRFNLANRLRGPGHAPFEYAPAH
jgi:hypothetical protein